MADTKPAPKRTAKKDPLEAKRATRAKVIAEGEKTAKAADAAEAKAAKTAKAPHTPKRDDAGAREQQKASVAADTTAAKLAEAGLDGPPVVAPVVEETLEGTLKLVTREEINLAQHRNAEGRLEMPEAEASKRKVRMGELSGLWLQGENFPHPGEVIFDIRRSDGQDHQRYSAWTDDGSFDVQLPGVMGPGSWLLHAEALITQVGDGREDHLPLIKVGKEFELEVTA